MTSPGASTAVNVEGPHRLPVSGPLVVAGVSWWNRRAVGGLLAEVDRHAIGAFVVASVVPKLNAQYQIMSSRHLKLEPLVVAPGVKTGMPILTNNPREVGADLIVAGVAAFDEYGGPCIVVDFGTATTFSAVSGNGEYLGTCIAPGIEISMDALTANAAKLSKIELIDPGTVIGKTTVQLSLIHISEPTRPY